MTPQMTVAPRNSTRFPAGISLTAAGDKVVVVVVVVEEKMLATFLLYESKRQKLKIGNKRK